MFSRGGREKGRGGVEEDGVNNVAFNVKWSSDEGPPVLMVETMEEKVWSNPVENGRPE